MSGRSVAAAPLLGPALWACDGPRLACSVELQWWVALPLAPCLRPSRLTHCPTHRRTPCLPLLAPCLPRLIHRQTMAELQQTAQYQRRILQAAVQLVKPGGALVFSTCSINPGAAFE